MDNFPPTHYVKPCKHRLEGTCQLVERKTGFSFLTDPKLCAQCMWFSDEPSEDIIFCRSLTRMMEICDYVALGFYQEGKILEILRNFYGTIEEAKTQMRPLSYKMIPSCEEKLKYTIDVCHGRILVAHETLDNFVRTELPNILPKDEPSEKSFGIIGYTIARLSGKVKSETKQVRFNVCSGCTATDSNGEKLYREIDGKFYCGQPRTDKLYRDEKSEGCGCELAEKVKYRKSQCPIGKWGFSD